VDATKASLAILVILILAALFGVQTLHQFGVSLDAFQAAGGGVLAWMGFGMLMGNSSGSQSPDESQADPSLTPLILFAASPGTITGVITVAVNHSKSDVPFSAIVAVCVAVLITWPLMIAVARVGGHGGQGFVRDTISRFMGLIVIAMGVQFALTGIRGFFNGPLPS
jgi:multiple antibiotic resistance protein